MFKIFFSIFQFGDLKKNFKKFELQNNSQNVKFWTLWLGVVRVLSRIASFASKYDCSNPLVMRCDVFVIFFNFRKRSYFFFPKFELPSPVVGSCQCIIYKNHWSNLCSFSDMTFFQKIFSKHKFKVFFSKGEIPNPLFGGCQSTLRGCKSCLQIWHCSFRVTKFLVVFQTKFEIPTLYLGTERVLSGVANLSSKATAQLLSVSEI